MKKCLLALSLPIMLVFAGVKPSHAVILNGVDVPKDKLILYLFIGHSNMTGYGGIPDTVRHPRVWAYNDPIGFWNARDPVESPYNSPSPFMPFLKKMADLYPDYYFCGVKVTQDGLPMANYFLRGKPKYDSLMQTIGKIKDSVTIGGILAMFGFVEGISDTLSQKFDTAVMTMLSDFRQDLGIPDLPLIMGRYEENADTTKFTSYYTFKARMIAKLELLQSEDPLQNRIMLTPFYAVPVPKTMYYDSHHYNAEGYELWSSTAAEILYKSNWNGWYPPKTDPLKMLYPRGGECFPVTGRIPITWMCDPESLSVIFIQLSQDSGKTWSLISGDVALFPSIKTFYWNPSQSGLTFLKNANLLVEVIDYDEKHSCRSNYFSFDTTTGVIMHQAPTPVFSPVRVQNCNAHILVRMEPSDFERTLRVYSLRGERLVQFGVGKNADFCSIPSALLASGTYLLTITRPSSSTPERTVRFVFQR